VQSERPELAGLVFAVIAGAAVALGKQPNGLAGLLYSVRQRLSLAPPTRGPAPSDGAAPAAGAATNQGAVADAVA
jgi:hypothetical protein